MPNPPFPEVERVIYERNPLTEVLCQLRFPAILRVQTAVPADFQDRIRRTFPVYRAEQQSPFGASSLLSQFQIPVPETAVIHRFLSEDETSWSVTLTRDFLAVATLNYERWEDFEDKVREPVTAFENTYEPASYSRIGLRYKDLIRRSQLDLDGTAWSELLQPFVLGELAEPEMAEQQIIESSRKLRFRWGTSEAALMQYGLETADDGEECFLIDFDFYSEAKTATGDALSVLRRMNRLTGRAFRWCITEKLHNALGPTPLQAHD
jgi:uncharacterized protein (TIGR04255 family)